MFDDNTKHIIVGVLFIFLGISFAYKCILAMFRGRLTYWYGFMPFTIISPFLIHLPPGKNSLIKSTSGWWVHVIFGPIFFFASLYFLAFGADLVGLPGSSSINYILTLGPYGEEHHFPTAITFNKQTGYTFPIIERAIKAIYKVLSAPLLPPPSGN